MCIGKYIILKPVPISRRFNLNYDCKFTIYTGTMSIFTLLQITISAFIVLAYQQPTWFSETQISTIIVLLIHIQPVREWVYMYVHWKSELQHKD